MLEALRPQRAVNKPLTRYLVSLKPFRYLHDSHRLGGEVAYSSTTSLPSVTTPLPDTQQPQKPPLSLLSTGDLVRSYFINLLSSNRLLLAPSLRILSLLAHSESPFLNPDRNGILRYLLKKTFYAQFCAGETKKEIQASVNRLKQTGFAGVILAYAKEIVVHGNCDMTKHGSPDNVMVERDVEAWKDGNLRTIDLTDSGDFLGLKFTGAGMHAVQLLAGERPRSQILDRATTEICELAKAKNVGLLFDAEQHAVQQGIDAWTIDFQRKYNGDAPGNAIVYGTYQAYLRSTPATLAEHLVLARNEGFTLGVKLVRGAYFGSDPHSLFWESKEETDRAYDGIAEALIKQQYNDVLRPRSQDVTFPEVNLVLASHNHASVRKAMYLRKQQSDRGGTRIQMVYGQLMGMADEVSCELVLASKQMKAVRAEEKSQNEGPKAFKYVVWGSVGECTKYLLRRAQENRDAVLRANESRIALWKELRRRMLGGQV